MSSQAASHASLSVQPDEGAERMMTATSGRKCLEQYMKSGPLSSLARTLLESSRWYNPVASLEWRVKQLPKARVTTSSCSSTSQKQCARTSKKRDMPSGRLLFRLVPSVHHTAVTECGSSPRGLMPTPMAVDIQHTKRIEQLKASGGRTMGSRANGELRPNGLMDYMNFYGLMPTPSTQEFEHPNMTVNSKGRRDPVRGKTDHSVGLADLAINGLLPTPTSQDFKKRGPRSKQKSVENFVRDGFILTPSASDGLRAAMTMDNLKAHNKPKANLSEQIAHKTGGGSSHLSPLFVEEMMGYPLTYLVSPFLMQQTDGGSTSSQDGGASR